MRYKMGKENLRFGDIEIEKRKFYLNENPVSLKHVDTENLIASKKISSGRKNCRYFIGYWYYDYNVKPLHIMLP